MNCFKILIHNELMLLRKNGRNIPKKLVFLEIAIL